MASFLLSSKIKVLVVISARAFHSLHDLFNYFQATIICDVIVLYVLKARALYYDKKYLEVIGDDAYKVCLNGLYLVINNFMQKWIATN